MDYFKLTKEKPIMPEKGFAPSVGWECIGYKCRLCGWKIKIPKLDSIRDYYEPINTANELNNHFLYNHAYKHLKNRLK